MQGKSFAVPYKFNVFLHQSPPCSLCELSNRPTKLPDGNLSLKFLKYEDWEFIVDYNGIQHSDFHL
jgi:hypothetical protein